MFTNPHALLIRTSLSLALVFGFSLGLYLMFGFAFDLPLATTTPALMQVHGQVQAVGFVTLFIIAVGVQLFPRFHSSRLDRPRLVSAGGLLLALGLLVALGGTLGVAAFVVFVVGLWRTTTSAGTMSGAQRVQVRPSAQH